MDMRVNNHCKQSTHAMPCHSKPKTQQMNHSNHPTHHAAIVVSLINLGPLHKRCNPESLQHHHHRKVSESESESQSESRSVLGFPTTTARMPKTSEYYKPFRCQRR
eukprot:2501848-Amphidinium_carterae.1